ncbi:hypothetical protein GCM10009677_61920 [Sphaerisporangium rubeum]|uniref:Uncharacterized protein n=1 Tax=Sphaerisporangium rubeum TaxID=321317 RepID=A0A7X0IA23_9ACTN|nr:hypothetical protein [Sphaerisporangium rubeum]MBB6471405.1 hypothetical protein [Sphaerisporangium rubeum]
MFGMLAMVLSPSRATVAPFGERSPPLVPDELVPHLALAQEWGKRKAAESPQWSADKWRRVAVVFGVEVGPEHVEKPAPDRDGTAA